MLKKALANTAFHHFGYENAEIRSMTWVEKTLEKEINHFLTTKKNDKNERFNSNYVRVRTNN